MKRIFRIATLLTVVFLTLPAVSRADEAADKTAIQAVITAINDHQPTAPLLTTETANTPEELVHITELERLMDSSSAPMSEKLPPKLVARSIRFITQEIAILEAESIQLAAVSFRTIPVLFVMKKEGTSWRIASFRMLRPAQLLGL